MSAHANSLPLPLRLMNLAGRGARVIGWQPVGLKMEELLAAALENTGLSDFGGEEFQKPFALLLESLEKEARLSLMGRMVARGDILRGLENRLRLVDVFKQHPEIAEQPIERPIFVVGPPRTGTTIFHDLLAMDPGNRVPQTWEACYPLPPPESATYRTDPRIAKVQADLDRVDSLIPEFKKMHPMGAERAQECVTLTAYDFASMIFNTQFRVPGYENWVMSHDMKSALRWHRKVLQVLQWKAPGERWALKSPQHMWHLQHVHREYPDALFVQPHRDPVRVLVSISSLVATLRSLSSDRVELADVARDYARGLALGWKNMIAYRKSGALAESQVVDLYFQDFMQDQVGTVRRAYEHFGLQLSSNAASAMQGFLDENPFDKHGRHLYKFSDIGMGENEVRSLFREYQDYFEIPSEAIQ